VFQTDTPLHACIRQRFANTGYFPNLQVFRKQFSSLFSGPHSDTTHNTDMKLTWREAVITDSHHLHNCCLDTMQLTKLNVAYLH